MTEKELFGPLPLVGSWVTNFNWGYFLGWCYRLRFIGVFALVTFPLVLNAQGHKSCAAEIAFGDFNGEWDENFSHLPSLDRIDHQLGQALQRRADLPSGLRSFLTSGGTPLQMGRAAVLLGINAALLKKINRSGLPADKIEKLRSGLDKAISDLMSPPPPPVGGDGSGGNGGDGESGNGGIGGDEPSPEEVQKTVEKIIRDEFVKRCIKKTAILFIVSNAVNAVGAVQAKWSDYADDDKGTLRNFLSKKLWENASDDADFRHNMTFNALLMTSMGAMSCVGNKNLGKNAMAVMAAATSAIGQYVSDEQVKPSQILYDTLFIRFISVNKSNLAFHWAEKYQHSGRPMTWAVEAGLQLVSESAGAWLYPRGVTLNQRIWGTTPLPEPPVLTNPGEKHH